MTKKKWYKRKRIWILLVLVLLFIWVRTERFKFRYQPEELVRNIAANNTLIPTIKSIVEDGKNISFLQMGERPKFPLVVFVHGSPGALDAYTPYFNMPELSKKADLISVDRMGFGYSDFGKSEGSLYVQAKMIATVLERFPHRKKILVGHSMGGPIIAKMAIDFPEVVDALVMIAPSISPELEPSNTWRKIVNFPLIRWFTPSGLRVCNQEIIPLEEELDLMMDGWASIKVPVSVIQGTEDKLVPEGNADFAKLMLVNSHEVKINKLKGGNHFILWSEVPLITGELLYLLEKI